MSEIDWQRVRVEAAISALQGILANPSNDDMKIGEAAVWAEVHADLLVSQLQKGKRRAAEKEVAE